MRKTKKILAGMLVVAMAIAPTVVSAGTTTSTGAAAGTVTGEGASAGWVDTEVLTYEVTTASNLNFKIDPLGLLSVADGQESATLTNAGSVQFGAGSAIKVKNKSSVNIGVNVTASITSDDTNLKVVTDAAAFATSHSTATDTSICISTTTTPSAVKVGVAKEGTVISAQMKDASSEYVYKNTSGKYSYELKSSPTDSNFKVFEIAFTGKVSAKGDWSAYKDSSNGLGLKVVYEVDKLDKSLSPTDVTVGKEAVKFASESSKNVYSKSNGGTITYTTKNSSGTSGKAVASVRWGGTASNNSANPATVTANDRDNLTVTLAAGAFSAKTAGDTGYLKLTFQDGSTEDISVEIAD